MLRAIGRRVDEWKAYNRTVRELRELSNRDLLDLGITRDEIKTLAKQHVTMNM